MSTVLGQVFLHLYEIVEKKEKKKLHEMDALIREQVTSPDSLVLAARPTDAFRSVPAAGPLLTGERDHQSSDALQLIKVMRTKRVGNEKCSFCLYS